MQVRIGEKGTSHAVTSSLEDEVAAWRSKRALRPEASIGQVRVVRIRKRVPRPLGPSGHKARTTHP
jgi:hypothetical protein